MLEILVITIHPLTLYLTSNLIFSFIISTFFTPSFHRFSWPPRQRRHRQRRPGRRPRLSAEFPVPLRDNFSRCQHCPVYRSSMKKGAKRKARGEKGREEKEMRRRERKRKREQHGRIRKMFLKKKVKWWDEMTRIQTQIRQARDESSLTAKREDRCFMLRDVTLLRSVEKIRADARSAAHSEEGVPPPGGSYIAERGSCSRAVRLRCRPLALLMRDGEGDRDRQRQTDREAGRQDQTPVNTEGRWLTSRRLQRRSAPPFTLLMPPCNRPSMTMTMTHSHKSVQQLLEAWPYRLEWRGHDPAKKNLLHWCGLLCWQGLHVHTVGDSVQYIGHERETWRNT